MLDLPGLIGLRLNNSALDFDPNQTSIVEHEITALLKPNNLLEMSFSLRGNHPKYPVGIFGPVTIEIGPE